MELVPKPVVVALNKKPNRNRQNAEWRKGLNSVPKRWAATLKTSLKLFPHDITFSVGDKKITCHKFVLAIASPFFEDLIEESEKLGQTVIEVIDFDLAVFNNIIQHAYMKDDLVIAEKDLAATMSAAHLCEIQELEDICATSLQHALSTKNAVTLFQEANGVQNVQLLDSAHEFILRNFHEILDSEDFLCFTKDHLCKFLKSDNLHASSYIFIINVLQNQNVSKDAWLKKFTWLAYSSYSDKTFCKFCIAFNKSGVGKGGHQTSALVSNGFDRWKNAIETFESHQNTDYHKEASVYSEKFISNLNHNESIASNLDKKRRIEVDQNRKVMLSIIETIILCGRQNIALRGNNDFGRILEDNYSSNDGNFRNLLRFRVKSGDDILNLHLLNSKRNAMYTSWEVQNTIISLCGDLITDKLVDMINKGKYFSLLVDETTDVSTTEQLSLCIRYWNAEKQVLREDFLCFTTVTELTGEKLADTIFKLLLKLNINVKYLRGQSYDGASNFSGKFQGVQAKIIEKYPTALYTYCANHKLNLVISDSCSIPGIRNCLGTVKEVQAFFSRSVKRTDILQKTINSSHLTEKKKKRLVQLCETRWVERHESILTFAELFPQILETLEKLQVEGDRETQEKSSILQKNMEQGSFLVAIKCLDVIMSITVIVSRALQKPEIDLHKCYEIIQAQLAIFGSMKENAKYEFKKIYSEAENLANISDVTITIPRICRKQKHRSNIISSDPEEYYRLAIFIPFLDHVIASLTSRFDTHQSSINKLFLLLPKYCIHLKSFQALMELKEFYVEDVQISDQSFESELKTWIQKWKSVDSSCFPINVADVFMQCDPIFFPSIYTLLNILSILPVTTASAERSFSSLTRVKTYLRNSMGQERLNGLATLNINRDIECIPQEVLNKFALLKKHRLPLLY